MQIDHEKLDLNLPQVAHIQENFLSVAVMMTYSSNADHLGFHQKTVHAIEDQMPSLSNHWKLNSAFGDD